MFKRVIHPVLLLGLVLALPIGILAVEPANLSLRKREISVYINSGNYTKDIAEAALHANKYLPRRIARGLKKGQKMAIVFDIDETALTNLPHILEHDFGYTESIWDAWVAEGRAHAIIPVQTVYDTAIRNDVAVFFITGRKESDRPGTERNLRDVGYEKWTEIFYKPAATQETSQAYKTAARKKIEAEGYVIIANLGDQLSDLEGKHAERTFKLPNPFYLIK